jgi:predicted amidohydrolase YtcJ
VQTIVLHGGSVVACDTAGTHAPALAIRDGRVAALGDLDEARAAAGPDARLVDIGGATVLPGLVDTHPHLMHFGVLGEPLVDLSDAVDHRDVVTRIAAKAAETPPGEWVMASPVGEPHYFIRRSWRDLAEGELPDRTVLDRATREHPVLIQAFSPVTPNVVALNSAGLDLLGIGPGSPDRIGNVWIEKRDGLPTGRLHGSVSNYYSGDPYWDSLVRRLPIFQPAAIGPGTERAMSAYNALGVTTVYEGHAMDFPLIEAYRWLRSENRLSVRVLTAPEAELYGQAVNEPLSEEQFEERLEQALRYRERTDDMLRIDGVTISRGGPCWPGFVLMRDPYTGPYGEPTTGRAFVSRERAQRAIEFCSASGLRLNLVSAGLAEHDDHLEDLEANRAVPPGWILQHGYFLEPEQIRRYAAAGFEVTTSIGFRWGKQEMIRERFGEALLDRFIPLREIMDSGMAVGCGSDWGPKNIFEQIALACEHGLTREESLATWTRDAARILRWEGVGTLTPGAHADLVVVDRDPLSAPSDELASTRVLHTLLGGATVFDSGSISL